MTFASAVAEYIATRRAYEDAVDAEDAAFKRWIEKVQRGERTSAAAASRLANQTSQRSADLASAEIALYQAAQEEGYDTEPDACYGSVARYAAVSPLVAGTNGTSEAVRDRVTGRIVARFGSGPANRAAAEREADRLNGRES